MGKYIFDTNCFYQISFLDADIIINDINEYFCSFIQYNEIKNKKITKDFNEKRKERLLKTYKRIKQQALSTESFIVGDPSAGVLGKSKLGTTGWFSKIKEDLNKLKNHKGNHNDALIAEITIRNNLILVTNDVNLYDVIKNYYSDVITLTEFKKRLKFK